MLFGMGSKKEEAYVDELEALLNSLFDKKAGSLGSKGSSIADQLARARVQFSDACKKFEEVNDEPEAEYFFIDNINFIKGQKLAYTKALRRILDDWTISSSAFPTLHAKYSQLLSGTDMFIKDVLRSNNNFKKVLRAYPDYLDLFKGSFSLIERLTESLRNELERTSSAFSEYNKLKRDLDGLNQLMDELSAAKQNMLDLTERIGSKAHADNAVLSPPDSIFESRKALSDINAEIVALRQRIADLTLPLDRVSKKFDHNAHRKRELNRFIENPAGSISLESDYNDFKTLLEEMRVQLDEEKIEGKNEPRVRSALSKLANADLYGMILQLRSLQEKHTSINEEIRLGEERLSRAKEAERNSMIVLESKDSLSKRISELDSRIEKSKEGVEMLFLEYYGKKLLIKINK